MNMSYNTVPYMSRNEVFFLRYQQRRKIGHYADWIHPALTGREIAELTIKVQSVKDT